MVRPMTCPVCGKPVAPTEDHSKSPAPFCSDRCKQIDFFRWNNGRYAIVETLDEARLTELTVDPDPSETDSMDVE